MRKNHGGNDDSGLFFLFTVIGWAIKLIVAILLFPLRVFVYDRNPLNVKRVRIEK